MHGELVNGYWAKWEVCAAKAWVDVPGVGGFCFGWDGDVYRCENAEKPELLDTLQPTLKARAAYWMDRKWT